MDRNFLRENVTRSIKSIFAEYSLEQEGGCKSIKGDNKPLLGFTFDFRHSTV